MLRIVRKKNQRKVKTWKTKYSEKPFPKKCLVRYFGICVNVWLSQNKGILQRPGKARTCVPSLSFAW